jgi:hypothetical protein
MKRVTTILGVLIVAVYLPVTAQVLNVSRITQSQNQWCWAGVSACVLEFYGKKVSQCEIAEFTRTHEQFTDISFGSTNCCTSPASCNNWNYNWGGPGSIEDILSHFAGITSSNVGSFISLTEITTLIEANRPFIIRWGWTAGGGHFIVGHGINGQNISYMNPWPGEGKKIGTYDWIKTAADHTWTHTSTFTVSAQPPGNAGTISGPVSVCQGMEMVTYFVPPISRAIEYVWTLPEGVTGKSSADSIVVSFGAYSKSGEITVTGKNNLGNGSTATLALEVNPLPAAAGAITGKREVCHRQRNVTYTVPEIKDAEEYVWNVQTDATFFIRDNSITLSYGVTTGTGTLSVKGRNSCGEGPESTLTVTLSPIPETPVISHKGNVITSSSTVGNQWYNSNGPIEGATGQEYAITESGDYYVVVTINGCVSDPSESLTLILNGLDKTSFARQISVYPNPVTDQLRIEAEAWQGPVMYKVFNALGQVVYFSSLVTSCTLDVTDYPKGIYLVKFEAGNDLVIKKFIKE